MSLFRRSKLKCQKCGYEFDYKWIPFASLTSIRWGKKRYLRCPKCHKWSWFDIKKTEVNNEK